MATNKQWILKKRPEGEIKAGDLDLVDTPMPTCGEGQVLVKNTHLSIDPTHRIWMSDAPQYMPCVELGECMRALTAGIVEESKFEGISKGDLVGGIGMCQECFVSDGGGVNKLDPALGTADQLGPYSLIIGLTAWYGTVQICKVKAGETFVVSGAAGAVGSLAGQLAKMMGARVIGTVGSAEKGAWLKELGFDGVINYKTDDIKAKLKELAPDGVDCYFDNTAGPVLEEVLLAFNNNGRIAQCGLIHQYNTEKVGVKNYDMILMRRLTIQGFICIDQGEHMPAMLEMVGKGIKDGKIKYKLDVQKGLDKYIDVVNMLYTGANTGKLILEL